MTRPQAGDEVSAFLAREQPRVDAALARALDSVREQVGPDLSEPIRHGVLTGGKRLRPILCVEAYRACTGEAPEAAYDLGASVEMIHAYSLMHDDLPCMDDAELRRGQPTAHRVYGEEATIVSGAALIPLASLQAWRAGRALGCDDATNRRLLKLLNQAAGSGGMVGGQVLDLMGEDRNLTADELDNLHRRKTGALLTAPLVMGGVAAGASAATLEAFRAYGVAVGLAFQVADDILDATSSAEALGKNPSDLELHKSTYVRLHGLDEARARANALVDAAAGALESAEIASPNLLSVARYIVERDR